MIRKGSGHFSNEGYGVFATKQRLEEWKITLSLRICGKWFALFHWDIDDLLMKNGHYILLSTITLQDNVPKITA